MLRSCSSELPLDPLTDSQTSLKFLTSLHELRELRSQIHYAADYCEAAFKGAQEKKTVMNNTREYICRAVVTVVDHLGSFACISANLESRLKESDRLSEVEFRISCLKQEKPEERSRELVNSEEADSITKNTHEAKIEDELPLFMYTNTSNKIPLSRSPSLSEAESKVLQSLASVLPVPDGLSIPPETKGAAFHFQMVRKNGRRILQWRIHDNEILSLIRRSKKESLKLLKF